MSFMKKRHPSEYLESSADGTSDAKILRNKNRSLRKFEEDCVNDFLSYFRRNKVSRSSVSSLQKREDQSLSIAAAYRAACMMHEVVEAFREREQAADSPSKLALRHGEDAVKVATEQVVKLLHSIGRVGKGMQAAPMFRLMLGNVTHRVLSIVREAAAAAATTPAVLEQEAKAWLNSLPGTRTDDASSQEPDDDGPGEREATASHGDGDEEVDDGSDFTDNSSMPKADSSDPYADVELSGDERSPAAAAAREKPSSPSKPKKKPFRQQDEPKSAGGLGKLGKGVTFPLEGKQVAASSSAMPVRKAGGVSDLTDEGSSSVSSDFLSTPPRQHVVLQRASSVIGEQDLPAQHACFPVRFDDFVDRVLLGIGEFESMLDDITAHLCENAAKQLNEKDIVVTLGVSHSTGHFLLRAADDLGGKTFKVVLLDASGGSSSRADVDKFAATLRERGVEVSVLPDSSAFAVMAICSKVLIGCENVLANGGLLARMGTHALCIAARHFSVPVLVVTMTLKMTPHYPSDATCSTLVKISRHRAEEHQAGIWEVFSGPLETLPAAHLHPVDVHQGAILLDTPSAMIEYVPADLISLFVTNDGEYTVSQIHRIVRDNYNVED
jgi:translation initiation factor eIF-2B subunit beta